MTKELKVGELKNSLQIVRPAISTKDFIPIFSNFCFTPDTITGFSEPVGIEIEAETGVNGGIKADTLLTWLNSFSDGTELHYETKEGKILFKSGRSKLELPLLNPSDFIHEVPKKEDGHLMTITDEFIKAIDSCLLSVNPMSDNPSMSGVTISRSDELYYFHSTNGIAISEYTVEAEEVGHFVDEIVILPVTFCNILKKLYKEISATTVTARVTENTILVTFNNGGRIVKLWSKLLDTSKTMPLDFEAEISNALDGFDLGNTFDIDDNLVSTVKRILSVYGTSSNEAKLVTMASKGNELTFSMKKNHISIDETVTINNKQPKVSATIDLEKLLDVLHPGGCMSMLQNLVLVTNNQFTYLQAYKND